MIAMYLGFHFILITIFNDEYSVQEHKSTGKLHYNKDIGTQDYKNLS